MRSINQTFNQLIESLHITPLTKFKEKLVILPMGKERRSVILDYLEESPDRRIYINCKHWPQLKNDSDLKYLLKKGYLKQLKTYWPQGNTQTYLVKV